MTTLPAGTYYVGDLCYVMNDEWDEVCDLMFTLVRDEGIFTLKSGVKFAIYRTAWGDGEYLDQFGKSYSVDSGTIGCILVDDIDKKKNNIDLGNIHTFTKPFETYSDMRFIHIGDILIDTDPDDEDDA